MLEKLGSLKDSNATVHSADSDIFYAVIHRQVHAWWSIDGEMWQGIVTKTHIVIWTMFGHKTIYINLPFTRWRKLKDVENLTYKFCSDTHLMFRSRMSQLTADCGQDASIVRDVWKCESFGLNSCLDENEYIAAYMKLACSTVSVCFNYSTTLTTISLYLKIRLSRWDR